MVVQEVPTRIPSDDELELAALDFLRQRFLRADERVVELLAILERQVDAAPPQERLSIRHAADQIDEIQRRLHAQVGSMPAGADERRKILKGLLQVQDGALQQLSVLVEHNRRQEAKVSHPTRVPLIEPRDVSVAGRILTNAYVERSLASKTRTPDRPLGRARRRRRVAVVDLIRSHRPTVLAAMAVAAVYAYAHLPRAHIPFRKDLDRSTPAAAGGSNDPPKYPASLADADDTADRKSGPQSPGTITTRPSSGDAESALELSPTGPVRMQPPEGGRRDEAPEPGKDAVQLGLRQARIPAASEDQGSATSPVRKPSTPAANSENRVAEPDFVAVVFTHREADSAIGAFAELQQRYPRLLAQRKGEAQPIEIAEKGIWHRVVVLPAGPRQNAESLCDQLQAAGYDRCWVKPY
jgi:hypothetical protein